MFGLAFLESYAGIRKHCSMEANGQSSRMLNPYWIETDKPMSLGFGITAHSEADAKQILRLLLPGEYCVTHIATVSDMRSIDQRHVAPNMGNWMQRGVWYPCGFGDIVD
jgi:hypothetical protein